MEENLRQLIGSYPSIYEFFFLMPGGAGFLPSEVCLAFWWVIRRPKRNTGKMVGSKKKKVESQLLSKRHSLGALYVK